MNKIHTPVMPACAFWFCLVMAVARDSIASQSTTFETLTRQIEQDPNNSELQQRLAAFCLQVHREGQALAAATAARKADPEDLLSKRLLITALARTGDFRQAMAVLSEEPTDREMTREIAGIVDAAKQASGIEPKLEAAIQADSRGAFTEVAEQLESAVKSDPENPALRKTLGWVYLDKLHWPRKAYPHIDRLAKMHPDDAEAQKLLALACSQTGRLYRALTLFRRVLSHEPKDNWMRFNQGRTLARLGRTKEAQKLYAGILEQDGTNFSARLGLAELAAWRGQLEPAKDTLHELLQEKPHDAEAELLLADIHRWNWQLSAARVEYAEVLKEEPYFVNAQEGLRAVHEAGGLVFGAKIYHFTDDTDFGRSFLEGSLRIPLTDKLYLLGRGVGWRFTNPGFENIDRFDGSGGFEYHAARWFEIAGEAGAFQYEHHSATYGGHALARFSPVPNEDLYVSVGINEPFVSSIVTVAEALRQNWIGGGCDLSLGHGLILQGTFQAARITDGNRWLDVRPRLAYRLLRNPDLRIGTEYEYLTYEERRTTYWTPSHRNVIGPIVDLSMDLWPGILKLLTTAQSPYVFSESEFGIQVQAGLEVHITQHFRVTGSYIYSSIPGDTGAWSGSGWQAALNCIF